ncbi:hypothetical protein ANANG_G00282230 [Anguilla anguilla]|uniref:Uncharacterized protein n=1 Tax=Anguilla anguilla TaxID=7936 RepID=A0A9D3LR22_ANGAN|nr:hypothetical protein ANANG_G00282230 [Anguilla anguilla]
MISAGQEDRLAGWAGRGRGTDGRGTRHFLFWRERITALRRTARSGRPGGRETEARGWESRAAERSGEVACAQATVPEVCGEHCAVKGRGEPRVLSGDRAPVTCATGG